MISYRGAVSVLRTRWTTASQPLPKAVRLVLSLTGSGVILRGGTAIASILIARHFGPSGYGVYASALAVGQLLMVVPDFGSHVTILRDGARHPERLPSMLGAALLVKSVGSVLAGGALFVAARWLGFAGEQLLVFGVIAYGAILLHFQETLFAAARARGAIGVAFGSQAGIGVAASLAAGGAIAARANLIEAAVAISLAPLIALAASYAGLIRRVPVRIGKPAVVRLLRQSVPFAIGSGIYLIYARLDVLMLAKLADAADVGLYNAPYRLVSVLYFLPGVVCAALFADLSRFAQRDSAQHRRYLTRMVLLMGIVAVAIAGMLTAAAPEIIEMAFGREFMNAVPLLQILAWFLVLQSVSYPLADGLTTRDRQNDRLYISAGAALLSVVGNAWAIPRYGAMGAATVTLLSQGALVIALAYATTRNASQSDWARGIVALIAALAAGALATAVMLGFSSLQSSSLWIRLSVGMAMGPLLVVLLLRRTAAMRDLVSSRQLG